MPEVGVQVVDTATPGLRSWWIDGGKQLTGAMTRTTNRIKNKAKKRLVYRSGKGERGGRDTGQLSRSIGASVKVRQDEIFGIVAAGVKYARYVEGWNKAGEHKHIVKHFVSFKKAPGLRKWAKKHGLLTIRSGKAAASWRGGGLIVGGPDFPSPFMEPTFKAEIPRAEKTLQRALRKARAKGH